MKKIIWSLLFILPLIVSGCSGGGGGGGDDGDGDDTPGTYTVSGTVSVQIGTLDGATITLTATGVDSQTATTATDGTFSFTSLAAGSYTLTPSKTDFVFTPTSIAVTVAAADVTAQDFVAAIDDTTFKIAFNTNDDLAGTDVWTMTLDGENRTQLTTNGTSWIPRFSSDKTIILYQNGYDDLMVMNADGTDGASATPAGGDVAEPSFASDGSLVIFTHSGEIYSAPADGSADPTQLTTLTGDNWGTVVFPSGDALIFSSQPTGETRHTVYKMNIDGTEGIDLTPDETTDAQYMSISGDGTKIAYGGGYTGTLSDVFLMNADGSDITNISADETHENHSPSVSYDGTKVVFNSDRPDAIKTTYTPHASEIYIANADGTEVTQLTNTTDTNTSWKNNRPQFLRDGRILFISKRDGLPQIYVMDADGTDQTLVSDGSTSDNQGSNNTWDKPSF